MSLRSRREILISATLFAIAMACMIGLAFATGWQETWHYASRLNGLQVLALLFLSLWNYGLRGLRWHLYTRVLNLGTTILQDFRHYIGGLAMTVTPGRVGELIRLRWVGSETGAPLHRTAPLVVVDRASDLAAIACLLALSAMFANEGMSGGWPAAVLAITVAITVTRPRLFYLAVTLLWRMTGRWPRLFGKARGAARALAPFSRPRIILPALALGAAGWFAEGVALWLLLDWMGAEIDLWAAVGIFILSMLTGGATGMPGGLGGAEAAMVTLLTLQGIPLEMSVPVTAIIRLTTLWFAIALGFGVFPFAERYALKGTHALE